MAIQVRRGNESDFDASKMLPGEWAVSLDTKYVRMCFAPGVVLRMATYEGFEADKAQFQAILAECRSIQSAVQRIQAEVNSKASLVVEYSNSAKKSADSAYKDAERAKIYADNAEAVTGIQIATKERAGLIKGGDNHIAEDGTLMLITATTSTTQPNSYAGREMVLEIGGVTEQEKNPSPTNPQEIKKSVVSGVKTHWKNFANFQNDANGDRSGFIYVAETPEKIVATKNTNNGVFVARFVAKLKANVTYHISLTENRCQVNIYYDRLWGSQFTNFWGDSKIITPTQDGTYVFGIFAGSNIAFGETITVSNFQIEEGTVATSYEPYTESSYIFSQPIDLYGMDDVQDVTTPKKIEREYGEIVLSDLSGWAMQTSGYFYCPLHDAKKVYSSAELYYAWCDSYKFVAKDGLKLSNGECTMYKDANYAYPNQNWFYICDTSCTSTSALNAKLKENPIKLVYPLQTPTTEALPIADQIGLNSLATYDGITYVEFDAEIQPTFKAEYGTSKVGGYTLESLLVARNNELRLTAVENAVVNNI